MVLLLRLVLWVVNIPYQRVGVHYRATLCSAHYCSKARQRTGDMPRYITLK